MRKFISIFPLVFFILLLLTTHLIVLPSLQTMLLNMGLFTIILFINAKIINSYHNIVSKKHKTEADIKRRKTLIATLSFSLNAFILLIPFILQSFGYKIFGNQFFSFTDVVHFGSYAILISTIVFLSDNIINRILSPIYTYEDVKDLKNFCIYLRSFKNEKNKEEKKICSTLRHLFPVYAIGDPNKILQPNGAKRIYLTDELWKETVTDLLNRSKVILLRIGQTEGTVWETNLTLNNEYLKKTIFIANKQEDYEYFSKLFFNNYFYEIDKISIINASVAFFFYDDGGCMKMKHITLQKIKNFEIIINELLKQNIDLDNEYTKELDLRSHYLKYMFDKNKIPKNIRHSLNWGIFISPIVNIRRWPLLMWVIFLVSIYIYAAFKIWIPLQLFILFVFLFGNRIEWSIGGWSCASMFFKNRRYENTLMLFAIILGIFYAILYISFNIIK